MLTHPHGTILFLPPRRHGLECKDTLSGDKGEVPQAFITGSLITVCCVHAQARDCCFLRWLNSSLVWALFVNQGELGMRCLGLFWRIRTWPLLCLHSFIHWFISHLVGASDGKFPALETLGWRRNEARSLSSRRLSYSGGERQQMTNYDVGWKEISRGIHSMLWK